MFTNTVRDLPKTCMHIKKTNTAYYARSFEVSGTLAYNNIPDHVKQQPSLNQFKSSVKRHLLAQKPF